jgi:hypothetical protein
VSFQSASGSAGQMLISNFLRAAGAAAVVGTVGKGMILVSRERDLPN